MNILFGIYAVLSWRLAELYLNSALELRALKQPKHGRATSYFAPKDINPNKFGAASNHPPIAQTRPLTLTDTIPALITPFVARAPPLA